MGQAAEMRLRADETRAVEAVLYAAAGSDSTADFLTTTLDALDEHAGVRHSALMLVLAAGTQAYSGVRHGAHDYVIEEYFERWAGVDPLASAPAHRLFRQRGFTGVAELYHWLDPSQRRFVDDFGPRTDSLEHLSLRIPVAGSEAYLTLLGPAEPSDRARRICVSLVPAIGELLRGRLPRGLAPGALSPRESQVVELVALGFTNREIGANLRIEERTVEKHLEHVYGRLGVSTRTELAFTWATGRELGLPHRQGALR
jgi:DNA-binding CsgD family transcriptional regulator